MRSVGWIFDISAGIRSRRFSVACGVRCGDGRTQIACRNPPHSCGNWSAEAQSPDCVRRTPNGSLASPHGPWGSRHSNAPSASRAVSHPIASGPLRQTAGRLCLCGDSHTVCRPRFHMPRVSPTRGRHAIPRRGKAPCIADDRTHGVPASTSATQQTGATPVRRARSHYGSTPRSRALRPRTGNPLPERLEQRQWASFT